jgi:hypothetical protein
VKAFAESKLPHPYVGCSATSATGFKIYGWVMDRILGAFTKLRKATVSSVMSIRPSIRMEQLGSHWTDFD